MAVKAPVPNAQEGKRAKTVPEVGAEEVHYDLNGKVFTEVDFTMKQIYDAIPQHCFHPWMVRSLGYVARDFFLMGSLLYAASYIQYLPSAVARFVAWTLYTVLQGMVFTGIWILAHECGHGAFSESKAVNHTVGLLLHSFLLVPFHAWRLSHSKHHKATGNMEREVVFVPHTRESFVKSRFGKHADARLSEFAEMVQDAPIVSMYKLFIHQVFGWPLYLFVAVSGPSYDVPFYKLNHFYFGEDGPYFGPKDTWHIIISDIAMAAMIYGLYLFGQAVGHWNAILLYGVPYLMVNHWIVAITYLQHSDGALPHYHDNVWTFAKGATATIDRDFGFIGRHLFHSIIETHVLHHLVSTIPFYYSHEATAAIKKVMGASYISDMDTNLLVALWRNQRNCMFAEESVKGSGILFYRNLHGKGMPPRRLTIAD
ncbi:fatty acid desaturase-domain-containing protein [Lipomyces orientalis]|uniref:Fatty acid desaturase-domain-containing protein n=1 Tax=Lipomyces orientalis TaxID=1233043 RepID=A0ACC3TJJ6_9ASCO